MAGDGGFLVEDFIDAITTQLDRVQDTLRLKAVNRPLTYALKDLQLDLKVFIDMDRDGRVRFRSAGAEDTGASVVHFGFTTITKPMIEENTISMTAAKSASLDELGLKPEEQRRLERMGVSNLAQLQKLGSSAGVGTVARLTDVPLDRIRHALRQGAPAVHAVQPAPRAPSPVAPAPVRSAPAPQRPVLRIPQGSQRMTLLGRNFMSDEPPQVSLDGEPLAIREHDTDRIVVDLPPHARGGTLAVSLGDGEPVHYELAIDSDDTSARDDWLAEGTS
ncbi:MAG: hypothetical protein U1F41_01070 [Burkholderiales bacterium]